MRESNYKKKIEINITKKTWYILGGVGAAALLAGLIFFFVYFRVENVQVMESTHYSDEEIKKMVLRGPLAGNSVLAPLIYTKEKTEDIPFIEGFAVTQISRDTIAISLKEKRPVGCIPYLDSYIYFDRSGVFIEGSKTRDERVPYFDGIQVNHVVLEEKLPIKGTTVLNTAVALATIFQKNQLVPDHIQFDENYQISLVYGEITVMLGKDSFLEDKMARVIAILPQLEGKIGVLHVESVTDNSKTITFEEEPRVYTSEDWPGGYDEYGNYDGYSEYDEKGEHVGPKPLSLLDYALENWVGGYDEELDYTGWGEYDVNGNYVGPAPTEESLAANGDWVGGFEEDGSYTGKGEYDFQGEYVGPNPNAPEEEETEEPEGAEDDGDEDSREDGYQEEYDGDGYDSYGSDSGDGYDSYDNGYYEESYGNDGYDSAYYGDGY